MTLLEAPTGRRFGPADEHPYRRLPGDAARVVLAMLATVVTAADAVQQTRSVQAADRLLTSFPDAFDGLFRVVLGLGSLWAAGLVAIAALLARRLRLALVLATAGAVAWFVARFIGFLVAGDRVVDAVGDVFGTSSPGRYPAVHLCVITAVVVVAGPYVTRPTRRLGHALVWLAALGTVAIGSAGVVDAAAGLAIAWGVAAAIHLAFGSPAGRPTLTQITAALAELALPCTSVELLSDQPVGATLVRAEIEDGRTLLVRVLGRDAADTRLLAKAWRFVAYKESGPSLMVTRLQQVEHEALCLLLAQRAGVRVPGVATVGVAGPSAALLALDDVVGAAPTASDDPVALDRVLEALWEDVAGLRRTRVAHGALDVDHLRVDVGPVVALVDFDRGSAAATTDMLERDAANALVASATLVGDEAAVAHAERALGTDSLLGVQRYLSKPVLSPANRRAARADKDLLERLTGALVAATDEPLVQPVELRRVKPLNIVMVVALLFALWVILGQVGSLADLFDTLRTASWPWLAVGFVLAQSTAIAFACTTIGSVAIPIPLVPAVALQLAVSFANLLATTGAASTLMNIRFLQKQGVDVGAATSSGVLVGLSGSVTQFVLFVATAWVVGQDAQLSEIGGDRDVAKLVLLVVAALAVALTVVVVVPKLRRMLQEQVWPQVVSGARNIWGILTTPRQLGLIVGGSVAAQLLYSACLLMCVRAYGGSLSYGDAMFVNMSASFLAGLVPVPGGIGVTEAAMIAGLTAFGVPPDTASAAVLTHRLFTTFLPPIWGNFATKWLLARGYL